MNSVKETAAAVVSKELSRRPAAERPALLRSLLAHAAAGLVVIEGARQAGEAIYRLADAVVASEEG